MREPVDLWKPYERYPDIVYTTADHKSWHLPPIRFYPLMPRHACLISDVRTSLSFKSRATPLTGMKTDLSPVVARRAVEITDKPLIRYSFVMCTIFYRNRHLKNCKILLK
ncbi:hypothetical protein NC652_013220 [Populus alba x Populus x berolinensis]|nr:hypothetical protein NC652_013220 [Populus alba x Populus x berolinensis]